MSISISSRNKKDNRTSIGATCALISAVLGFFMISCDVTALNVALPAIHKELVGASLAGLQWVVDSYTLIFAALMLSAGLLSDKIGVRSSYACGLGIFIFASLACGLSLNLGMLIIFRMIQGAGAAIMLPSSLALIQKTLSTPQERAHGIALWTVGGAVAVAAGPILGGIICSQWIWQGIFYINIPVGIIALGFLSRVQPSAGHAVAFDMAGQVTMIITLLSITFAIIQGGHQGFNGIVLSAILIAIISGMSFIIVESKVSTPLLPLAVIKNRETIIILIAGFVCNLAFYGGIFILSLFFQEQAHKSTLQAGLMFVPMALITACFNYLSPKMVNRFSSRITICIGILITACGCMALSMIDTQTPWPTIIIAMIPLGVGGAIAVPALTSQLLESADKNRSGTTAALFNTSRQCGGAIGIAVYGVLIGKNFSTGICMSMIISTVALVIMIIVCFCALQRDL